MNKAAAASGAAAEDLKQAGIYDTSTHLKLKSAVCFTLNQALSTYTQQVKTAPHSLIRFFHWCYAFLA